jgi:hypothetical protein
MFKREFNDSLGYDEINVCFISTVTGDPIKVISGIHIHGTSWMTQMTDDGNQAIILSHNGYLPITLVKRIGQQRLDLVSIDGISIAKDGTRFSESAHLPSISGDGSRFCFLSGNPPQIWVADIVTDGINTDPSITGVQLDPNYVLYDRSVISTFKAHVTTTPPDTVYKVTFDVFKDGAFQSRAVRGDWPNWYNLVDDGTFGDENAGDGYFANNTVRRDLDPPLGDYTIRIAAINSSLREITAVDVEPFSILEKPSSVEELSASPKDFYLHQNYPNPFNPKTTIVFSVKETRVAILKVFNTFGQEVATLFNETAEPGQYYKVDFDASELSSGVYLYSLECGDFRETKKIMLLR